MTGRCAKTEAGRNEIRTRALALSRTARNLLLVIDGTKSGDEWVSLVNGATAADLDLLLSHGLVEPLEAPAGRGSSSGAAPAPGTAREAKADPVLEAMNALTYGELYTLLTDQARARFGLIKGYRMVLEIEKASGLPELQAVAQRLITQVREEHGDTGIKAIKQALGI